MVAVMRTRVLYGRVCFSVIVRKMAKYDTDSFEVSKNLNTKIYFAYFNNPSDIKMLLTNLLSNFYYSVCGQI